jgi:hypothetical protein
MKMLAALEIPLYRSGFRDQFMLARVNTPSSALGAGRLGAGMV